MIAPSHAEHRMEIVGGDCLGVGGLATWPDQCFDCVITDPPFEDACHGKQRRRLAIPGHGVSARTGQQLDVVREAPLPFDPITPKQRKQCAREFARLARRWVIVFAQTEAAHLWRYCLESAGLDYVRTMVWTKPDAQPQYTGDRPGVGYESIVVAHPPGRKRWNGGGRVGVFSHTRERGPGGEGAPHPTTKPLPLMRELVELFTDPGELVLDPFAGSGSTGVACRELGRGFVGYEINPEYAAIARRRIAGEEARPRIEQPSLF